MSIKRSLLTLAIAVLGLSVTGIAYGWLVGGAIRSDYKSVFNNHDLYCDLGDKSSTLNVDASVSPLFFRLSGTVICWEVNHGAPAKTEQQSQKFLFNLMQVRMVGGLEAWECRQSDHNCADGGSPPTGGIEKRTTWVFKVGQGVNADLLWRLIPADDHAVNEFCKDHDDHPISAPYCGVNIGLDEHEKATSSSGIPDGGGDGEKASDYLPRDVDGDPGPDLKLGEIFRFTTETSNGVEEMKNFYWGPCHSGQYSVFAFPGCIFAKDLHRATITKGRGHGK
jgi:hypothetical protein